MGVGLVDPVVGGIFNARAVICPGESANPGSALTHDRAGSTAVTGLPPGSYLGQDGVLDPRFQYGEWVGLSSASGGTLYHHVGVAAVMDPANRNNSTNFSDWLDMRHYDEAMFVLLLGSVDVAITAKIQQATDNSGTGAIDIPGKTITALGGSDDNKQAVIFIGSGDMLWSSGYICAALRVTVGNGTTNILGGLGIGYVKSRYPFNGEDHDQSSVAEITF